MWAWSNCPDNILRPRRAGEGSKVALDEEMVMQIKNYNRTIKYMQFSNNIIITSVNKCSISSITEIYQDLKEELVWHLNFFIKMCEFGNPHFLKVVAISLLYPPG